MVHGFQHAMELMTREGMNIFQMDSHSYVILDMWMKEMDSEVNYINYELWEAGTQVLFSVLGVEHFVFCDSF